MTLEEAKMTIYANCIYACEKAGFDLSTICMVDDALRTVIAIADRKTEPQTDGYMTVEQTEDYRKMLDKAEHKVYGNIEDEPQTCSFSDCDNFKNPDYARCIECKRKQIESKEEPQTERSSE